MSAAVVYVQLQHDLPRCFWSSLQKTRKLWEGDIYLIAPERELHYVELQNCAVKCVKSEAVKSGKRHQFYTIPENDLLTEYERSTFFDYPGWDGFWDNACKRFVYIQLLQEQCGFERFIHLESDVIPYIPFKKLFESFDGVYKQKIVFSPHAHLQMSCCFVFCNSAHALIAFNRAVIEYFKRGIEWFAEAYPSQTIPNETHFAYTFHKEHPEHVGLLPTLPGDEHHAKLKFLVDPTAWGMWVGGLRWEPGKQFASELHTVGKQILEGNYDVRFSMGQPYVYDVHSGLSFPLATVHFNSKRPEQWI